METTVATPEKVAIPIRKPKLFAVVQVNSFTEEYGETIETRIIEGENVRDLKAKLVDPGMEIVGIFRGRRIQVEERRQVVLKF